MYYFYVFFYNKILPVLYIHTSHSFPFIYSYSTTLHPLYSKPYISTHNILIVAANTLYPHLTIYFGFSPLLTRSLIHLLSLNILYKLSLPSKLSSPHSPLPSNCSPYTAYHIKPSHHTLLFLCLRNI